MSIKQQGGIFGRNPTFNNVDVEGTLTTSGSFAPASFDATGDATVGDQLAVGTTEKNGQLHVYSGDSGASRNSNCNVFIENNGSAGISIGTPSANSGFLIFADENGTARGIISYDHTTDYLNLAAAGSTRVSIQGNNIALNNGGGIDFSATSGTGTSELFDDYEEGNWTPAFSGGDYSFTYNKQKGSYTKIGNRVYVDCVLYIHPSTGPSGSSDGNVSITGLPYAFNKQNDVGFVGGIIHFKQLFMTTAEAIGYRLSDGGTSLLMYDTLATTYPELNYVQASDVNANSRIRLQFSYPTNG